MSQPTPEQIAMLGHEVLVLNPNGSSSWAGKAIAIAMDPSIVIEQADGRRMTLPLAWAARVFDG